MLAAFQGFPTPYGGKRTGAGLQMLSLSDISMALKLALLRTAIIAAYAGKPVGYGRKRLCLPLWIRGKSEMCIEESF